MRFGKISNARNSTGQLAITISVKGHVPDFGVLFLVLVSGFKSHDFGSGRVWRRSLYCLGVKITFFNSDFDILLSEGCDVVLQCLGCYQQASFFFQ